MHTFDILLGYDFLDHYTTSLRYPNLFKLIDIVICTKINQLTPSYIRNCPFLDFLVPEKSLKYRWISRGRLLHSDQTTYIFSESRKFNFVIFHHIST